MIRRNSSGSALLLSLLVLLATPPVAAAATQTPIEIGVQTSIWSETLGETRPLRIYTPPSQAKSRTPAAVLYVLDGANNFFHTAAAVDFLIGTGRIPEMIVVGIPTLDRGKDLTPSKDEQFLKFLTTELAPWIESRYRTAPFRIITGHSRGGLFTLYTLLNRPEAFNAYVAVSPALWWGDLATLQDMEAKLKRLPPRRFLYMTDGNEAEQLTNAVAKNVAVLKRAAPPTLEWHYERLPNEEHMSTPHRTIYDGLEHIFSGMQVPRDAILKRGIKGIEEHYAKLSARYGFDIPLPLGMVDWCGYYLLQQGKPDMAVDVFKRNVELNPLEVRVYGSLGTALNAAGRKDEALEALNKAYQLATAP